MGNRNIYRSTIQSEVILALLRSAGSWVPLPEILALGIAQYNARIWDCRKRGLNIENRTETIDGVRYSWFRLVELKPLPASTDWYVKQRGKPRPPDTNPSELPLFEGTVRP